MEYISSPTRDDWDDIDDALAREGPKTNKRKAGSKDHPGSRGGKMGKTPRDTMKSSFHLRLTAEKIVDQETLAHWLSGSVNHADDKGPLELLTILKEKFTAGRVSLEKGKEGQAHFQCGVLTGPKRLRRSAVRDFLSDNFDDLQFPNGDYCEPAVNQWATLQYCAKAETHIAGPWEWGLNVAKNRDLKLSQLPVPYVWQQKIIDRYAEEPAAGTSVVHWYTDEGGQVGKTTLCKMLSMSHDFYLLDGGAQKMKFQAAKNPAMGYCLNLTRSKEEHFSYDGIESISDGYFCDTFGSDQKGMVMRMPSHIAIFANFSPEVGKMSEGRIKEYVWNGVDFI